MTLEDPELIEIQSFTIAGLKERTKNQDEFNPQTAKLPKLWEQFYSSNNLNRIPNRKSDSPIYGVYSDYDSDDLDYYSVTAGIEILIHEPTTEFSTIKVEKGNYLVFKNYGPIPKAVIETWQMIWHYFRSQSNLKRSYKTDFEIYLSPEQHAIYIGVTK